MKRGPSVTSSSLTAAVLLVARSLAAATPPTEPPPAVPPPGATQRGAGRAQTIEINMVVGESRVLSAQDVKSYTVGAPGVADVKLTPDGKQFALVGLQPGSTTILMLKGNGDQMTYAVSVFARSPEAVQAELEALLVGYTGLRIRRVGTRFFIEGGVSTEADARRIGLIAALYPGQVESLVVAGSVGIEHTINIRIDFYFVQYDKSSNYAVGVAWPGAIGPGTLQASHDLMANTTSATATITQPLPALDVAQTRGWAKVLKHSTVVTTSGSEATFENGGEQNFQITTAFSNSIQAIKFGTNVTVLPRYDASSRDLEVKVGANVADLTPPAGTTSLPGRQTATIATFVHLKLGQSIVLSGIRTSSVTHSVTGIPLLSQIPVLGVLFGGHTNSEEQVEGAVFIVPSIVESVPQRTHDIVETAVHDYEKYSGNIDEAQSYPHRPPDYR